MRPSTLSVAGSSIALVILAALASPTVAEQDPAYLKVTQIRGILDCAAGSPLFASDELCSFSPESYAVVLDAGTTGVVVEMAWTNNQAFNSELALAMPKSLTVPGSQRPEGPSPLRAEIAAPASGTANAQTISLVPGAGHDASLVIQQPFTIYVSDLVGLPIPPGYSAIH